MEWLLWLLFFVLQLYHHYLLLTISFLLNMLDYLQKCPSPASLAVSSNMSLLRMLECGKVWKGVSACFLWWQWNWPHAGLVLLSPEDLWGGFKLFSGGRFNSWTSIRGFFASDIWQLLVFWSFCHKPAVDAVHYIVGRGCLNFVGGQVTAEVVRISLVGSYREHLVVPLYVLVEVLGAKEEHWHGPLSWQEYSADVSLVPPNPRDLE